MPKENELRRNWRTGEQRIYKQGKWRLVRPDETATGPNLARGLLQGATFGFGDELIGAGVAGAAKLGGDPRPFGNIYREARDAERQAGADFSAARPTISTATNFAGGAVTGGAGGARAMATPYAQTHPIIASGLLGGGAAATAGAGNAPEMSDVPGMAATGAMFGVPLGVALPMAGEVATRGVGGLMKGVGRSVTTPAGVARRGVVQEIARDDDTVGALVQRQRDLGPEATLADAAGESLLQRTEALANMPGAVSSAAQRVMNRRQSGQFRRFMQAVRQTAGREGEDFTASFRRLAQAREEMAAPFYQRANRVHVEPSDVEALDGSLSRMLREGWGSRPPLRNSKFSAPIERLKKRLKVKDKRYNTGERYRSNIGELDNVRRELNDQIGRNLRAGNNDMAAHLMEARRRLTTIMDEASPDYRDARRMFADYSEMRDAMQRGTRVLRDDAEELALDISEMSEAAQDAYRLGAAKAVRDKLASVNDLQGTSASGAWRVAGSPLMRERLRNAFPVGRDGDTAFDEFMDAVSREQRFSEVSTRLLRNSRTAARDAGQADLMETGIDIATSGGAMTMLRRALDSLGPKNRLPEPVREEYARLLLQSGPDEVERSLRRLGARRENIDEIVRYVRGAAATEGPVFIAAEQDAFSP